MQGISKPMAFAILAGCATGAAAEDLSPQEIDAGEVLGRITLSASGEARALSQTGASVSVLTEEELKKTGEVPLAMHLARVPGVSMSRTGGLGMSTSLRIRGFVGAYIGVRMDGVDVTDPSVTQSYFDFGTLLSSGLSRVEVLRGSQSALYGSEAVAGVVDITGWRPEGDGWQGEAGLEAGSEKSLQASGSVGYRGERGAFGLTLARGQTEGISASASGPERDGFRVNALSFFAEHEIAEGLTFSATGFARNAHVEYDDQFADSAATEDGKLRGGRLALDQEIGAFRHGLSLSRSRTDRFYPIGRISDYKGGRDQLRYDGRWTASEATSLIWGLERSKERFTAGSDRGTAVTDAVSAELLHAPGETLDLSLALRHDRHEHFGGKTTGRVALAWRPGENWVIRAMASTGFRAPSLYELHSDYGNTALRPETSHNLELGAEYRLQGGFVQATFFRTVIDDRIGWDGASTDCAAYAASGYAGCYAQIPGRSRHSGLELSATHDLGETWQVFGNYTYTDARQDGSARPVRVPRHDLTLGLEGQLTEGLRAVLSLQHLTGVVDEYYDSASFSTKRVGLKDYSLVHLTLTQEIGAGTEAYLRLENLFDTSYQTVYNYNQPGRQVFIGVRKRF